ncbi:TolC family protein [Halomonas sp. Y3]|uniref:TolC family protein n=1 Tax=Halomonas sp. Y3 TaxID=2956797 RepID=UPI0020A1DA65|nr:TolC family protein [Halomonas sp. Y3]
MTQGIKPRFTALLLAFFPLYSAPAVASAISASANTTLQAQVQPAHRIALQEVLDKVASSTPAMLKQQELIIQAESRKSQARGAFLPQLDLSLQTLRSQNYSGSGSTIVGGSVIDASESFYNSYAALSAELSLFNGGQHQASFRAATSDLAANEAELDAIVVNEFLQALKLYVDLASAEVFTRSSRHRAALFEKRLSLAKEGFKEGRLAKTVVQSAEADWLDAQSELLQGQMQQEHISARLLRHLGTPGIGTARNTIYADIGTIPTPPVMHLVQPKAHIAEHPSLKAAKNRIDSAHRQLDSARGTILPKVSLIANYSFIGVDSQSAMNAIDDMGRDNFIIGLSLKQPLGPFTSERANIDSSQSALRMAQLRYDELQHELIDLAQEALSDLRANRQELEIIKNSEASAREAMELHRARARHGFGSNMEAVELEAEWVRRVANQERQELAVKMSGWAVLATVMPQHFLKMIKLNNGF